MSCFWNLKTSPSPPLTPEVVRGKPPWPRVGLEFLPRLEPLLEFAHGSSVSSFHILNCVADSSSAIFFLRDGVLQIRILAEGRDGLDVLALGLDARLPVSLALMIASSRSLLDVELPQRGLQFRRRRSPRITTQGRPEADILSAGLFEAPARFAAGTPAF